VTDSMLAISMGLILAVFGSAIWVVTNNEQKLIRWFEQHDLRDLLRHGHW